MTYDQFKTQYKALFLKAFTKPHRVTIQTPLGAVETIGGALAEWNTLVDFEELHPQHMQRLDCYEEWITIFPAQAGNQEHRFGR